MEGDVFQLEVPEALSGTCVARQYPRATFTKDVAMEADDVEFISLDHPLVESLIEYCLDGDRINGEIATKVAATESDTPGILFNYRLGYVSGAGDVVTEKFVRLYATPDGTVTDDVPELSKTVAPADVSTSNEVEQLSSVAEHLHEETNMEAWDHVESFAEEARNEREREIEIKRKHAQRYFQEQIEEWEERLETYQTRAEEGADMSAPIGNAKQKLESLRRERDEELSRLEEEKHVTPQEPDLVTAAFVVTPPNEEH